MCHLLIKGKQLSGGKISDLLGKRNIADCIYPVFSEAQDTLCQKKTNAKDSAEEGRGY